MGQNPHSNPAGWCYQAWNEGYCSKDDDKNPYIGDSEDLEEQWQSGREVGILDRYYATQLGRKCGFV
jgi:hypothetical protein